MEEGLYKREDIGQYDCLTRIKSPQYLSKDSLGKEPQEEKRY